MRRRWGRARGRRSDARGERGSLRGGGFLCASSLLLGGVSRGFRRCRLGFGFGGRGRRARPPLWRARRRDLLPRASASRAAPPPPPRLARLPPPLPSPPPPSPRRLAARAASAASSSARAASAAWAASVARGSGSLDFLRLVRGLREPSGEREDLVAHGRAEGSLVRIRLRRLARIVHLRLGRVERGERGVRAFQALDRGIRGCRLPGEVGKSQRRVSGGSRPAVVTWGKGGG